MSEEREGYDLTADAEMAPESYPLDEVLEPAPMPPPPAGDWQIVVCSQCRRPMSLATWLYRHSGTGEQEARPQVICQTDGCPANPHTRRSGLVGPPPERQPNRQGRRHP